MLQGILIIIFMAIIMVLIMTKKMPTAVALIVLAVGVCVLAGIPAIAKDADGKEIGFLSTVIVSGASGLANNIIIAAFAGWLGCVMDVTGIMRTMIKKGAELGGDKALLLHIILYTLSAVTLGVVTGLGGVIMIGTIVLPILIAVGIDKTVAAVSFLMAKGAGTVMAVANISLYATMMNVEFDTAYQYSMILAAITYVAGLAYVIVSYKTKGKKFAFSAPASNQISEEPAEVKGVLGALSMLTPLISPVLVAVFKIPVIPALLISILYATITAYITQGWSRIMNMLAKTFTEGFEKTAPAGCLMLGVGILLKAVKTAEVSSALEPILSAIVPGGVIAAALFFIILAPLTLYRGPFATMGLGAGLCGLFITLQLMTPAQVMVGFIGLTGLNLAACPTNSYNVWLGGYLDLDVNDLMKRMLPYLWPAVAVGIIVGTVLYV